MTITKWDSKDKAEWFSKQIIRRSYLDEVVSKLKKTQNNFVVEQYGSLSYAPDKYPLYLIKSAEWNNNNQTILITGGVHGYETSGVHGAIRFLEVSANKYNKNFNLIIAPCVSPWGYETINRWNPNAVDPNRSFYTNSPSEESSLLMEAIAKISTDITAHIDLHETTDTDNTEFRPALAARDGLKLNNWHIPDGFYLVGDIDNPVHEFQSAIIQSVKNVTHIALADEKGNIIGEPLSQQGVINYATKKLGLCSGFTNCQFSTTTEVYPDSPKVTDEDCVRAQVMAVTGALDFLIEVK